MLEKPISLSPNPRIELRSKTFQPEGPESNRVCIARKTDRKRRRGTVPRAWNRERISGWKQEKKKGGRRSKEEER